MRLEVEVIEIKIKKLASGDKSYRLILETTDPQVLSLEKAIADHTVVLTAEVE